MCAIVLAELQNKNILSPVMKKRNGQEKEIENSQPYLLVSFVCERLHHARE